MSFIKYSGTVYNILRYNKYSNYSLSRYVGNSKFLKPFQLLQYFSVCGYFHYFSSEPTYTVLNIHAYSPLCAFDHRFRSQSVTATKCVYTSAVVCSGRKDAEIQARISSLQTKKRPHRKKKTTKGDIESEKGISFHSPVLHEFQTYHPDFIIPESPLKKRKKRKEWIVAAFATADEYDLIRLLDGLRSQGLYRHVSPAEELSDELVGTSGLGDNSEVLHMVGSYTVSAESREIYFFSEGVTVFWNVPAIEQKHVLQYVRQYAMDNYDEDIVEEESESLVYTYEEEISRTKLIQDCITFKVDGQNKLEQYAFSNALALSVKLGIWEASLDKYIDSIEYVTEELSKTGKVVLSPEKVLQSMGQLFALRHLINLRAELLDTPDFYWEHPELEQLFQKTCNYLAVSKRTNIMNGKLSHCVELMELLKSHLSEKHAARLEVIIIVLILVEVIFEVIHFII